MGPGIKAWWLTIISGGILTLLSIIGARWIGGLSRRTEIDKMYMGRVESLEKQLAEAKNKVDARIESLEKQLVEAKSKIDVQTAVIQELREQHLKDVPCIEREKLLESQITELMQKLIGIHELPPKPGAISINELH